jgi:hypothetical protein
MIDVELSPHAAGIVKLFNSLDQHRGDLSNRMEGMCQVVSEVVTTLSDRDRKHIADAIVKACTMFGQVDKNGPTNRFVLQTLRDLAS